MTDKTPFPGEFRFRRAFAPKPAARPVASDPWVGRCFALGFVVTYLILIYFFFR